MSDIDARIAEQKAALKSLREEKRKAKMREYAQRPEVKAKMREYFQRPEVKAKKREYFQRPEVKAKKREYAQRPEVKLVTKLRSAGLSKKVIKAELIRLREAAE